MAEPVKIAIVMDGGNVQAVLTAGVPVEYVIVDYDTDGCTESRDVVDIPQGDGLTERGFVSPVSSADPDGPFVFMALGLADGTPPPSAETESASPSVEMEGNECATCEGCERPEADCSADPCDDVIADRDDDDGCPVGDPECLGNNGDCHDACESPAEEG